MILAKKIEYLRRSKKMTQDALAEKLGVSRQTIYKWETGENKPELNKLIVLGKLFNVSLDILLNDALEPSNETAPIKAETFAYRNVFVSKYTLRNEQSSIDHGCPDGYKGVNRNFYGYKTYRRNTNEKEMKAKGYTDLINLRDDVAVSFFIDREKRVFDIYGNHHEYFVCPFENFISANHTGGGQQLVHTPKTNIGVMLGTVQGINISRSQVDDLRSLNNHKLVISYFNKDGTTNRYTIPFNFSTIHFFCEEEINKHPKTYSLVEETIISSGINSIEKILSLLSEIKSVAEKGILSSQLAEEINLDIYRNNEKKGHERYNRYVRNVMMEMENHNRKQLIKSICLWGGLALLIGIVIITVSAL